MKEFIKRWLLVFAMAVVSIYTITAVRTGQWENTWFVLEILVTTLTICMLQLLTNKIPVRVALLKYLIDLAMVISTVLFFGWLWDWWDSWVGIWSLCATVIPVFIAAIVLDVVIVRRDVDIINKQIKLRRQKLQERETHDC
jgi:hypothetical protein